MQHNLQKKSLFSCRINKKELEMAQLALRGRGEVFSIYRMVKDFELDTSKYDISSQSDQEALYEKVEELVESGEIDAVLPSMQMRILFKDELFVEVDDQEYGVDEVNLVTQDLKDLFASFEELQDGEIIYLRREIGEGEFVFESNSEKVNLEDVSLAYIDCGNYEDILQEDVNEILCDSINIDSLKVANGDIEEVEGYFNPSNTIDNLYIVKFDEEAELYLLKRLDEGGTKLFDSDCYVDDFDKN